jgi:hypothetical protein
LAGEQLDLFLDAFPRAVVAEDADEFQAGSRPDPEESLKLHIKEKLVNKVVELIKEVFSLISEIQPQFPIGHFANHMKGHQVLCNNKRVTAYMVL